MNKRRQEMMKLFNKWKNNGPEIFPHNNKPIFGNKRALFDDIYGFNDVKDLFKMAIRAETCEFVIVRAPSFGEIIVYAFTYKT